MTRVQIYTSLKFLKIIFVHFVKTGPETLIYLFCESEIVILFWNNVRDWIWSRLPIILEKQHILFWF